MVRKGLGIPPIDAIKADLMKRNDLIPYKGTFGGTMRFFSKDNIHILNDKWVIAYFEDGHNSGHMLLKYEVNYGVVKWDVFDATMN